jgi:F0F1-type ATP synthase assembly protein I
MTWLVTKYLITAAIVVLVSEAAKRSDKLGGLIAALPIVTVLTLVWLYVERQPTEKIANHAWYTFWYVLPTLPMFLLFPWLLQHFGFWWALLVSAIVTIACFAGLAAGARLLGWDLLP